MPDLVAVPVEEHERDKQYAAERDYYRDVAILATSLAALFLLVILALCVALAAG